MLSYYATTTGSSTGQRQKSFQAACELGTYIKKGGSRHPDSDKYLNNVNKRYSDSLLTNACEGTLLCLIDHVPTLITC
jgi:hypothetical protein